MEKEILRKDQKEENTWDLESIYKDTIEYNKEVAKAGRLASYMHDTFSDID